MNLPRPLFEVYWPFAAITAVTTHPVEPDNPMAMELGDIAKLIPVNVVKLMAFLFTPDNDVDVAGAMVNQHDMAYTRKGIAALQAAGIQVLAVLRGGVPGADKKPSVYWATISNPALFAANVKRRLIDDLGCDGLDLDNEDPEEHPDPNRDPGNYYEVVHELRKALGPKGSPKAILSSPVYTGIDGEFLTHIGPDLDYVSTMEYGADADGQMALRDSYVPMMGKANVLVGVSCGLSPTDPTDVVTVAQTLNAEGAEAGGMMLWQAGRETHHVEDYYNMIRTNLTTWTPPAASKAQSSGKY